MTSAREIMTESVDYIDTECTVLEAAQRLARDDVGALPVCDTSSKHLRGLVTDRDLVVKVLAEGKDPATTKVIDLVRGEAITIGADDGVEEALKTMSKYQVRRLPVIDGTEMVGIISQADVARNMAPEQVGMMLAQISR